MTKHIKIFFAATILIINTLHAQFSVIIQIDHQVSCNGGSDAALSAVVNPAGASCTYLWSNGATTSSITDVPAGNYIVTVQNAAGGTAIATANLGEPAALTLTALTELPLFVNPVGFVDVESDGGTPPFDFLWKNENNLPFSAEEDLVDAPAGVYTLSATDANGCSAELTPVELMIVSAVKDMEAESLRAYPNPASENLFVELPTSASVQGRITDASGQSIRPFVTDGIRTEIRVNDLPDGIYFITIPGFKKGISIAVLH